MNKKWEVKFSDTVLKDLEKMSDGDYEKFEKIIKGFKMGGLDPRKIGKPVAWIELYSKLKCPECKSNYVEWLLDKNSNEVDFHCLECNKSFWTTYDEYKKAVKRNPDKIIHS